MTNINFHNLIKIKLINPPKVIKEFILEEFREFKSRKISKSNIILNFSKRIKIPSNCQKVDSNFYYCSLNKQFFLRKRIQFYAVIYLNFLIIKLFFM